MEDRVINRNKNLKNSAHIVASEYNKGNYENVLNSLPGFLEALSICLICDSETTQEQANEIISGSKKWKWYGNGNHGRYHLENGSGRLESASTIEAAKDSVLNKLNNSNPGEYINMYKILNGLFGNLTSLYNTSKQVAPGSHATNSTGKYNYKIVADADIQNIIKFKEIATKDNLLSTESLIALESFYIQDNATEDSQFNTEQKDAFEAQQKIEELTNNFDLSKKYIMIAPPEFKNKYGVKIPNDILLHLFRIPWTMVIDFNNKSNDGLYNALPEYLKSDYLQIEKEKNDYIPDGTSKRPWLFSDGTGIGSCKGDIDKWLDDKYPEFVKSSFDRMNQSVSDYVFICFYDHSEYIYELIRCFDRDFINSKNIRFITICNGNNEFEQYMAGLRKFNTNPLKLDTFQFVLNLWGYPSLSKGRTEDAQPYIVKSIDLTNRLKDFEDMGFELVNPNNDDSEDKKWNFYQGAEITWTELKDHKDVERDGLGELTNYLLYLIKQKESIPRECVMGYTAGSGSTTMTRRLGYDIFRKSQQGEFGDKVCVVMYLHDYNRRSTNEGLVRFSLELENDPILVFCDYCDVQDSEYDNLKEYCHNRNIIFFRLLPNDTSRKKNFVLPGAISKKEEWDSFARKYKESFGNTPEVTKTINEMESSFDNNNGTEVIEFPLCLEENVSDNLSDYVRAKMDELPSQNLKTFCEMVAFGYQFYENPINSKLFRSLLLDENEREYREDELINNLRFLLIKEENRNQTVWRPRFPQFAIWIMDVCSHGNWNSKTNLVRLAEDYINYCHENMDNLLDCSFARSSKDLDMLALIFAKRREDFRKDSTVIDGAVDLTKFSPFIQKVDLESGERILKLLIDYWPDYPFFSVHYARLLFERAYKLHASTNDDDFKKAGELMEYVLRGEAKVSDEVWHVNGMRIMRMIPALRNEFDNEKYKGETGVALEYINKLKDYVNYAQDSFKTCERLNSNSSYGFTAESTMYPYAIKFAKDIKQANNFDFAFNEYPWNEYLERFAEVIDILDSRQDVKPETRKDAKLRLTEITNNTREVLAKYYEEALNDNNSSERRILYSSIYYRIYKEKKGGTFKGLSSKEYDKLLNLYQNNAEICKDIRSYKRWFELLRCGNEPVTFEDAIEVLEDWRNLCEEKLANTHDLYNKQEIEYSLLLSNFYLSTCMTCMLIKRRINSAELCRKVREIETRVKKTAETSPDQYKPLYHRCFLSKIDDMDENELHCIEDYKSAEDEKLHGLRIEGEYYSKENKGYVQLDCGLNVTFYDIAKKSDVYAQGKKYKGVIVFKYGGTGMHEANLVEKTPTSIPERPIKMEETMEENEQEPVITKAEAPNPKTAEKEIYMKETPKLKGVTTPKRHGELIHKAGKWTVHCKEDNRDYIVTYNLNDPDLYDGQSVVFELRLDMSNPKHPNFMKAVNIEVDDEN